MSASRKPPSLLWLFQRIYLDGRQYRAEYASSSKRNVGALLKGLQSQYPESSSCRTAVGALDRILKERLATEVSRMTPDKVESLFKYIFAVYTIFVSNPFTFKQKTSQFHNLLKKLPKEIISLGYRIVHVPDSVEAGIKKKSSEARDEANAHVLTYKLEDVVTVLNETRDSNELYDLITFLLLSTGRRLIELFISDFGPNGHDTDTVVVSKLAKKRGKDVQLKYIIPVVPKGSAEAVLDKLATLRELTEGMTRGQDNAQITNRVDHNEKVYLTKLFGQPTSSHTCRKIYAAWAYMLYGGDETFNSFIEKALCHASLETSLHYNTVRVVP